MEMLEKKVGNSPEKLENWHVDKPPYEGYQRFISLGEGVGILHAGNWKYLQEDPEAQEIVIAGLRDTYEKARQVYEAGISSPEVYGVFTVPIIPRDTLRGYLFRGLRNPKPIDTPGIVMQHIRGKHFSKLSGTEHGEAMSKFVQEIEKAEKLGFSPGDHRFDGNSMWVPEERKVYLLDFDYWGMPDNNSS